MIQKINGEVATDAEKEFGERGELAAERAFINVGWGDVFRGRNSRSRLCDLLIIRSDESKLPIQVKTTAGSRLKKNVFIDVLSKYRHYVDIADRKYDGEWVLAVVNVFHKKIFLFDDRYVRRRVELFEAGRAYWVRFDYKRCIGEPFDLTRNELAELQELAKHCPDQPDLFDDI